MNRFICLLALTASPVLSLAQQPPPPAPAPAPAPAFAAPNLSPAGVRSMAANCAACHGPQGKSLDGSPYAALAGYPKERFVATMKDFREGKRPATIMHQIAKGYGEEETAALAEYFSAQVR